MLPDYKKLDEIDVLIIGTPTPESDRAMSQYINAHKPKQARSEKSRTLPSARTKPKDKVKH